MTHGHPLPGHQSSRWIASDFVTDEGSPAGLMAIGGETLRRSHDAFGGLGPLHLVSAWAGELGIALGQVATEEMFNEIAAIPLLLKQIALHKT